MVTHSKGGGPGSGVGSTTATEATSTGGCSTGKVLAVAGGTTMTALTRAASCRRWAAEGLPEKMSMKSLIDSHPCRVVAVIRRAAMVAALVVIGRFLSGRWFI